MMDTDVRQRCSAFGTKMVKSQATLHIPVIMKELHKGALLCPIKLKYVQYTKRR